MTNKQIKIAIGLLGLPLVGLGIAAMFFPTEMTEKLGIVPSGIRGMNTIRGDIGGLLLGGASMMVIGLWRNDTTWFLATAILMIAVVVGRLVGIVSDGFDSALIAPLAVELVIAGALVTAHRKLGRSNCVRGD